MKVTRTSLYFGTVFLGLVVAISFSSHPSVPLIVRARSAAQRTTLVQGSEKNPSSQIGERLTDTTGESLRTDTKSISLRSFGFDVVTVNSKGEVTQKRRAQAQFYSEDLGQGLGLDMVKVPDGTFMMGTSFLEAEQVAAELRRPSSNDVRADHFGNEQVAMQIPQRPVTIRSFFIGKFEVTQAQWRAIAQLPKVNDEVSVDPSYSKGNDLPVESVTWQEAIEFCARLSRATGREYRLPSEAEWEYACRAGTTTQFHFGNTVTPAIVNYNGNYPYGTAGLGLYREKTMPVGSLEVANSFGLFDMHGNVQEWCMDPWHENYNGAPWDGRIWITQGGSPWLGCGQEYRVVRGGSFHDGPCRSADRGRLWWTNNKNYFSGFRVVCVRT